MKSTLKASLTAILLTGVAAAPLASAFSVIGADAAYAKSDKANGGGGNGKSGNKGNSGNKGKSGSNGKSGQGGKTASNGSGKDPVGNFFRKLTGQEKKQAKSTGSSKKGAPTDVASGKPAKGSGMHPSELGNMNGALNANMNAVLAHVRNGNTNGPVGAMAMLAVAKSGAADAEELLGTAGAGEYAAVNDAVAASEEWSSVEEYLAAKEAAATAGEDFVVDEGIEAALSNVGQSDLDNAVAANETYASASDYFLAKEEAAFAETEFEIDQDIEDAAAALGTYDAERMAEYEAAEDTMAAVGDAEDNLLNLWNKNPGEVEVAEGETTPQEDLLELAYQKLEGYEDEIATAVEAGEARAADGEEVDDEIADDECEDTEGCEIDEEDMAAVTE